MNADLNSPGCRDEAILDLIYSLTELEKISEVERDELKLMVFEEDSCFISLATQRLQKEADDESFLH